MLLLALAWAETSTTRVPSLIYKTLRAVNTALFFLILYMWLLEIKGHKNMKPKHDRKHTDQDNVG